MALAQPVRSGTVHTKLSRFVRFTRLGLGQYALLQSRRLPYRFKQDTVVESLGAVSGDVEQNQDEKSPVKIPAYKFLEKCLPAFNLNSQRSLVNTMRFRFQRDWSFIVPTYWSCCLTAMVYGERPRLDQLLGKRISGYIFSTQSQVVLSDSRWV